MDTTTLILNIVQDNIGVVITSAIVIASLNFVIGWFMYSLFQLGKSYR